jgi:Ca2+:H+ antiporter
MLGSILSSLLLVLGCLFLVGGIKHGQQTFNSTIASTMSSLMAVASAALIIPAALYAELSHSERSNNGLTFVSRGTSIVLLLIYVSYLFFQLETYRDVFDDGDAQEGTQSGPDLLSPRTAGSVLIVSTLLVAKCAELLVDNIDSVVQDVGISKAFIGLILLPTFVNSAGYFNAVNDAFTNKMDLAIEVAIGSSLQIALFVTPLLVILGWIMGRDMTLHFQMFETVVFFLSTLVVTILIQDGKSGYLEGLLCLGMYIIIALAISVYPDDLSGGIGGGPLTTNALLAGR